MFGLWKVTLAWLVLSVTSNLEHSGCGLHTLVFHALRKSSTQMSTFPKQIREWLLVLQMNLAKWFIKGIFYVFTYIYYISNTYIWYKVQEYTMKMFHLHSWSPSSPPYRPPLFLFILPFSLLMQTYPCISFSENSTSKCTVLHLVLFTGKKDILEILPCEDK